MADRPMIPLLKGENKEVKYINLLSKLASTVEPVAQARIASCLVYKNDIVSFGICRMKTHPFQAKFSKNENSIYLHAETDCIKNALRSIQLADLSRCTLYICRVKFESRTKENLVFGMAKPCSGCAKAIATFDIKTVVYSLDNNGYQSL